MSRILVVDDEPDLCDILRFNLESEGFDVECANSAESALSFLDGGLPVSLILLDVMMERMSGYEMARRLRADGNNTPIIFLTALGAEYEQLEGFSSGADDYITKPFSFPTVLARIRAVLKRAELYRSDADTSDIIIDRQRKQVIVSGAVVALTKTEFKILDLLVTNKGEHFTRKAIMEKVWDGDICVGDRSVDVHIARLRKKIGALADSIVNHSGFGYVYLGN